MMGKVHICLVVVVCLAHLLSAATLTVLEPRPVIIERGRPRSPPLTQVELNQVCGVDPIFNEWTGKQFPWMAAIFFGEGPFKVSCGGALISEQYVLTAAQCVIDKTTTQKKAASEFRVRLGDYDISDDVTDIGYEVSKVVIHPKFNPTASENDIALLRLKDPVEFDFNIVPICLPTLSQVIEDTKPTIAGWGAVEFNGKPITRLMYVAVNSVSTPECQAAFHSVNVTISDSQLCAGYFEGGKGACHGDEGGPLMLPNADGRATAVGVISNVQCGKPGLVDIYTRTTSYLNWIKKIAQIN